MSMFPICQPRAHCFKNMKGLKLGQRIFMTVRKFRGGKVGDHLGKVSHDSISEIKREQIVILLYVFLSFQLLYTL